MKELYVGHSILEAFEFHLALIQVIRDFQAKGFGGSVLGFGLSKTVTAYCRTHPSPLEVLDLMYEECKDDLSKEPDAAEQHVPSTVADGEKP
jgi:hypothetical protein